MKTGRSKLFLFILLSLVFLMAAPAGAAKPGEVDVTFTYKPKTKVDSVNLAGSFNGWSTSKTPLQDKDGDGTYEVTISLKPGEYKYKFVLNGKTWIKPPNADSYVDDGFGGKNGVIKVGQGKKDDKPAHRGDGKINKEYLYHDSSSVSYINPLAEDKVTIKFKTKRNDAETVTLNYQDGEKNSKQMDRFLVKGDFDYYKTTIQVDKAKFKYSFEVEDGGKTEFGSLYTYDLDKQEVFKTPDWVKNAIFYQIFPERFKNGNPNNDPEKIEVYKNKDTLHDAVIPDWDQGVPEGTPHVIKKQSQFTDQNNAIKPKAGYHVFYGGDLQGVEEKIPYLKKLGINAIYFNPLFEATSNHKYNTAGYKLVEDNFAVKGDQEASEEYLRKLIKKLHKNDIKVIFDAVYNHTGYEHWAFQDVVEKGKDSKYSDWFYIDSYPIVPLSEQSEDNPPNYECWWDFGSLPKLNVNNPEVKEYLYEVTKKWMDPNGDGDPSDGVDGWRLDVANEVKDRNPEFWPKWRKYVKEINPEAYITGEIWSDATDYLEGDEFDAVMNYRFRDAVLNFIGRGKIDADKFAAQLGKIRFDYPRQAVYSLQNLIGSHDTKRYLTVIDGNKERLKLTSFMQMTYVGAPMIYYGDEIGMKGGEDPDCRRTMIWKDRGYAKPDKDLFNHYQKLIEIRKQEPALRRGSITQIDVDNEMVYAFQRKYEGEKIMVLINAGQNKAEVKIPVEAANGKYKRLYQTGTVKVAQDKLNVKLAGVSGAIVDLADAESTTNNSNNQNSEQEEKNKQSGGNQAVTSIVLLVLLGGIGYLVYRANQEE